MLVAFLSMLVVFGCYISWKTRQMGSVFVETKQICFVVYNIAVVGGLCG